MNNALHQWVENVTGDSIQSVQKLEGSTSSTLYRLQMTGRELVARVFDNAEWLADEPDLARHEAAVLEKVRALPIATPDLMAFDETGADCGGLPAILMTFLPGHIELKPANLDGWMRQLAETLAQIHAIPVDHFAWEYFAWGELKGQSAPAWTTKPENWQRAIAIAEGPEPAYRERFLHRDYHPMNVLWQDGKLCGIVDWPNACHGPAGVDVAHCRTNLVSMYGIEAADRFLTFYQQAAGSAFSYDPYWEIIGMVAELAYPVETYLPWATFGLTHITPQLIQQRLDDYMASVLAR
jgi:aminoglycoside phosphotransferase (APT) family kinase protein